MNLFGLDRNARRAARFQCDKHVYKMTVETTQILYTVLFLLGIQLPDLMENGDIVPAYKPTHAKHPCVLWTAACANHFWWALCLGRSLAAQAFWRAKKTVAKPKPHRCQLHLDHIFAHFALVAAVLPASIDADTWLQSLDDARRANMHVATVDPPEGCKFGVVAFEHIDDAMLKRGWVVCYRNVYAHKRANNPQLQDMTWSTRACDPLESEANIDAALVA
tara:strand:+ start:135 stop:794 length:660 start_codon:yes stop_codon:yes gene_type:complete